MRKLLRILPIFMLLLASCGGGSNNSSEKEKEKEISPSLLLDKASISVTETGAQLTINYNYATKCLYTLIKKGDTKPSINDVLSKGKSIAKSPYTLILSDLLENTTYELYVAAKGDGGEVMNSVEFTTLKAEQQLISNHTMVLYMMGNKTGLETSMDANLNKVKEVAKQVLSNNNHIMVFYDRGNYTQLSEILIEDGRTKQTLVKEYNSAAISSVDVNFMKDLFKLIKERTKSDSYGLVLSSHGGGWIPSDMFDIYMESKTALNNGRRPMTKFFGQDDADFMEIPDLSKALSDFHTDYIIFDACFMASVEALYDLRNNTDYIISSPIEVLSDGFPFKDIIPHLFLKDHMLNEVCADYMNYYSSKSGAISLIKTSGLEKLATSVKNIVTSVSSTDVNADKIQGFEGFNPHIFYDLEQYMQALTSNTSLLKSFSDELKGVVLYSNHTSTFYSGYGDNKGSGISLNKFCGLSCYIKSSKYLQVYDEYLKTNWAKAIGLSK